MAKYKDKWKTTFPATIGNQTRPEDGVDNTQEYNTDGLPQYMANDPVRYDLQNAVNSQLVSNDERLNEKIKRTSDDLAAHNKDTKAHATGISGNAATATKLQTPRTLSLTGKASGSATFDGSANAAINVTSVNADTASKLSTARKINITGNASGSAAFDGTSDVSINVSVSQAAHADKATQDTNGRAFTDTNAYMHISALANNTDFNNVKTTGIYYCTGNTYLNRPYNSWGILTVYSIGTVKQEYRPDNEAVYYTREYNNTKWGAWSKVNAANADTATNASHATNADSATTATNVSGKIYYSSDSPSVATNKLFTVKQAHKGDDNVPNNGLVIQTGPTGAAYNGKLYITDNGGDGVWIGGVASGKEVGWTRLVENKGSWNINSATATKLQTPRTISLTGNASGSGTFDGSGNVSINTTVSNSAAANKLADESGNNHININSTTDSWSVIGSNPGNWLKSIRTNPSAPPYSIGNYSAAVAFGEHDTKGIITHAYDRPLVKFAGGNGSTAVWKFSIEGGSNNEVYDLNNFPTKTGSGASGTWGINISGTATNADKLDGYHASDLISKIQDITPKGAAALGQFRKLIVNDSHQIKLPDGGTWAYFVYCYTSWSGDDSNGEHRTRTGAGIAAGGTVLHTDGSINSSTINNYHLTGTTSASGADGNNMIVGGFCWRIA